MHSRLDVQDFIDRIPFSGLQRSILWLCFFVVAIDGFDTAAAGFIAPAIREEWHLSAAALAPVFGAGLFGLMAGALLFGPLADRFGRQTILVCPVGFFGLASLASMTAPNLAWLIALRFLTGMGLGGAMPNAITLTSEYCPSARRCAGDGTASTFRLSLHESSAAGNTGARRAIFPAHHEAAVL
jgi:AAHS family 4-hydroxybenzoate transporter-like MFS transporter